MITVARPFLPPIEEYKKYVDEIFERNWLTNDGPLVRELEHRLKEYLGLPHALFLSNGTIALQIAIKALDLRGEIITTPFSYVATTSSIVWEACKPTFVDIDEKTLNIDPDKIAAAVNENTSAIVATHVYGNPCDIDAIQAVADRYNLKVIFDAAHCFGSKYKGKSVYRCGDVSTASFHATKLFHTIEGGGVFCNDPELLKKMAFMRNFGHNGPEDFAEVGINGKNSEFHAAMGLVNLKYIDGILTKYRSLWTHYDEQLSGLGLKGIAIQPDSTFNYAYYPVIFETERDLLKAVTILNDHDIFPRRYFYPPLNWLRYVGRGSLPACDSISPRILALPMYSTLSLEQVEQITDLLIRARNE